MRLIDANALPYEILLRVEADLDENFNLIDKSWPTLVVTPESIDKAPTVDAVPVVRCKDCMYSGEAYCSDHKTVSKTEVYCIYHEERYNDRHYCSFGERRTE